MGHLVSQHWDKRTNGSTSSVPKLGHQVSQKWDEKVSQHWDIWCLKIGTKNYYKKNLKNYY